MHDPEHFPNLFITSQSKWMGWKQRFRNKLIWLSNAEIKLLDSLTKIDIQLANL